MLDTVGFTSYSFVGCTTHSWQYKNYFQSQKGDEDVLCNAQGPTGNIDLFQRPIFISGYFSWQNRPVIMDIQYVVYELF